MWILHNIIKTNQILSEVKYVCRPIKYWARSSMCVGLLNNLSYPIIIQSTHMPVMI